MASCSALSDQKGSLKLVRTMHGATPFEVGSGKAKSKSAGPASYTEVFGRTMITPFGNSTSPGKRTSTTRTPARSLSIIPVSR